MAQRKDALQLIAREYVFDIKDGRSVCGILVAIDDQSNLLVSNAREIYNTHNRELGSVSIRKNTIDKISVSKHDYADLFG